MSEDDPILIYRKPNSVEVASREGEINRIIDNMWTVKVCDLDDNNGWIRFSDQLPEDNEDILFHDKYYNKSHVGTFALLKFGNPELKWEITYNEDDEGRLCNLCNVQIDHLEYWMRIPELPSDPL